MNLIEIFLVASIFLCSLVSGLVFTFAIVVMPGIKVLQDDEFLRAFKVMDKVIQDNQPVFLFVWVGSAVSATCLAVSSIWCLGGLDRLMAITFSTSYLFGVQLPTALINIPINNRLQKQDLDALNSVELAQLREGFEYRWNFWNSLRTVVASSATFGLIILALKI